jgi:hypothetical protein
MYSSTLVASNRKQRTSLRRRGSFNHIPELEATGPVPLSALSWRCPLGLDIDSHDLFFGSLFVNGVDVVPLVDAELNREFPGRELQRAQTPEGLRPRRGVTPVIRAFGIGTVRRGPGQG